MVTSVWVHSKSCLLNASHISNATFSYWSQTDRERRVQNQQVLVAGFLIHPQILDGCLCCAALATIGCQSPQGPWEPQHSSSVWGGMCSSAS